MPFINLEKAATLGDALLDLSVRLTENSTELRNWGYLEDPSFAVNMPVPTRPRMTPGMVSGR